MLFHTPQSSVNKNKIKTNQIDQTMRFDNNRHYHYRTVIIIIIIIICFPTQWSPFAALLAQCILPARRRIKTPPNSGWFPHPSPSRQTAIKTNEKKAVRINKTVLLLTVVP
jgi:hypothetical protein